MTITYRDTKGSDLTPAEVDANFRHVLDGSNTTFAQSGNGASTETVQDMIRLIGCTPDQFGAAGDGTTNDKAALQAAYDALDAAGGGVLYLSKGKTYLCNTACVFSGDNILITGPGTIKGASNIRPVEFSAATNNIVRGVKFLGVQGSSSVRASLMSIDSSTDIRVEGCWFDDNSSTCIVLGDNNTRVRIAGNTMTDFYENGVDTVGAGNVDVLVADNVIKTSGVHPDAAVSRPIGISMESQDDGFNADFIYRNNVISFDGLSTSDMTNTHGITVNDAATPATNFVLRRMVIEGNIIRGVGHGIRLLDTRYGTTDYGMSVSIVGNLIERARAHGIYIRGGEDNSHRDTVLCNSNIIRGFSESSANTYDGILVEQHVYHPVLCGNIIARREAESGAANGRYGINIGSANVLVAQISGNEVSGAQTASYADTSTQAVLQAPDFTTTVSLTADNQAVTVGMYRMIKLASDNATATNRTFTITAGQFIGQHLTLIWDDTDAGELADNTANPTVRLSATWTPTEDDTLTLVWDGDEWFETSRSAN
jgi:hypothetical protein